MTIGQKIRQAMDMQGMKQVELAEATNITEVSISRYVNDLRIPNTSELCKLCKALHISADWLLGIKDD